MALNIRRLGSASAGIYTAEEKPNVLMAVERLENVMKTELQELSWDEEFSTYATLMSDCLINGLLRACSAGTCPDPHKGISDLLTLFVADVHECFDITQQERSAE